MPCTDDLAVEQGIGRAEISRAHECQSKVNDWCSPFCQCACCAGFTFTFHSLPAIPSAPAADIQHAEHYISSIRSVSLPVWQPPQL